MRSLSLLLLFTVFRRPSPSDHRTLFFGMGMPCEESPSFGLDWQRLALPVGMNMNMTLQNRERYTATCPETVWAKRQYVLRSDFLRAPTAIRRCLGLARRLRAFRCACSRIRLAQLQPLLQGVEGFVPCLL
jgi:hypothetical protein